MFGGLDVALIMFPVSLRSEEQRQTRRRRRRRGEDRGNADRSKWREKCPYKTQLLELRPSLWGEEEIPAMAVERVSH